MCMFWKKTEEKHTQSQIQHDRKAVEPRMLLPWGATSRTTTTALETFLNNEEFKRHNGYFPQRITAGKVKAA